MAVAKRCIQVRNVWQSVCVCVLAVVVVVFGSVLRLTDRRTHARRTVRSVASDIALDSNRGVVIVVVGLNGL